MQNPDVELTAICEREPSVVERAGHIVQCAAKFYLDVDQMLEECKPEIVSICTRVEGKANLLKKVVSFPSVKGVWCEKPVWTEDSIPDTFSSWVNQTPIQVNYIRRFDPWHREIARSLEANREIIAFHVSAKADWDTIVHFADLALMWGVPEEKITYTPIVSKEVTVTDYELIQEGRAVKFRNGGAWVETYKSGKSSDFPGMRFFIKSGSGEWKANFMAVALEDLVSAVTNKKESLYSPLESAIKSERLAKLLLKKVSLWQNPKSIRL